MMNRLGMSKTQTESITALDASFDLIKKELETQNTHIGFVILATKNNMDFADKDYAGYLSQIAGYEGTQRNIKIYLQMLSKMKDVFS